MTDTPASTALNYVSRGWAPIPVEPRSKKPVGSSWQHQRITADDVPVRFGAESNIGVLLGEPSGWLVDVDLDATEAIDLASRYLPPTPARFGKSSTPECHRLYIAPCATSDTYAFGGKTFVELRASQQTVFPGSVHPSGQTIQWAEGGEPALVDSEDLAARVRKLAMVSAMVASGYDAESADRIADDNDALAALDGELGETLRRWAGVTSASKQRPLRLHHDADSIAERYNREHARDWPKGGTGQCPICGHRGCFGKLGENGKAYCFSASHTNGGRRSPSGGWLISPLDVDAHQAGVTIAELLRKTGYAEAPRKHASAPPSDRELTPSTPFRTVTFEGLPSPPKWLIENVIEQGTCTVLVSPPKSGKTWLTMGMGIALATAKPVLGMVPVEQGKTLYYSPEGAKRSPNARITGLCWGHEFDPDLVRSSLVFIDERLDLAQPDHAQRLGATLDEVRARLLIVDPLVSANTGVDENKANEMMAGILNPLRDIIASRPHCALVLVHHTNKGTGSRAQTIRGSTAIDGWQDTLMTVTREKADDSASPRVVEISHRDAADPGPFWFEIHHGPADVGEGLEWYRLALTEGRSPRKKKDHPAEFKEKILEALSETEPLSGNKLRIKLGCNRDALSKVLTELADDGQAKQSGKGWVRIGPPVDLSEFVTRQDNKPGRKAFDEGRSMFSDDVAFPVSPDTAGNDGNNTDTPSARTVSVSPSLEGKQSRETGGEHTTQTPWRGNAP